MDQSGCQRATIGRPKSFLYKISDPTIKEAVASKMGLEVKGASILENFMHSITIIRNLCAHGSRLFNRLFEQKTIAKEERVETSDEECKW